LLFRNRGSPAAQCTAEVVTILSVHRRSFDEGRIVGRDVGQPRVESCESDGWPSPSLMDPNLEVLQRPNNQSGYLGVKVTASGKFQPQLFTATGEPQRGLGSFKTAEEAARARAAALKKRTRGESIWHEPVLKRAERGTVRRTPSHCYLTCSASLLRPHSTAAQTLGHSLPAGAARASHDC
jgi:hypothetical protein